MPRTARFFTTLQEAFGDNEECVITQEPLNEIRGGLLQMDDATLKQPYSCDALLKWFDLHPTHPLTRAPLRIRMLHPVMTPQTDMADYAHSVRALAGRGWDLEDEVERDVRARAPVWKRDRMGDALYDPREVLHDNPWWVFTHTKDVNEARRALDVRYLRAFLGMLNPLYVQLPLEFNMKNVEYVVRRFLKHRMRMWRFPEGEQTHPIYMRIDTLTDDFCWACGVILGWKVDYEKFDTISEDNTLGSQIKFTLKNQAERIGIQTIYIYTKSEDSLIVLYPPSIDQWMRGIALPQMLEQPKWNVFRPRHDVASDIVLKAADVGLRFSLADIGNALSQYMTESDLYLYRRPIDVSVLDANDPLEHWLATTALPIWDKHPHPLWIRSSEFIATYFRVNHDPCPFSHEAIQAAVERTFEKRTIQMYKLSEEDARHIRKDTTLLPSDPYLNLLLLPALKFSLELMPLG